MKHSALPFFAGQHRQERFGARTVFSPLPVMTNVPPVRRTDWLTKKHPHYIELGGTGGSLFQTQLMYSVWVVGLIIFAMAFWGPPGTGLSDSQGWAGVWAGLYKEVWVGPDQWVVEFRWVNLLMAIGDWRIGFWARFCLAFYRKVDLGASAAATLGVAISLSPPAP